MQDQARIQHEQMKQQIAAGFGRAATTYDRVGPHFFSYFGQRLVTLTSPVNGMRILDVAAGKGAILFPVAEHIGPTGHAVGIDLSEQMVQETNAEIMRRELRNAEIHLMDAEQLNFPDASFDGVYCGFALFFLPSINDALAECHRVLKPGGYIAVSTWGKDDTRWSWYGELLKASNISWDAAPWVRFQALNNEKDVHRVLTEAGFQDLHTITEEREFVYTHEEEWWNIQWSHGMRHILETLSPVALQDFKHETFHRMQALKQPDGLHQIYTALLTWDKKPL
ncbi:class I SAM-dependent methyltransferase [Ktedonobacter robiniae]|nr:class I SAM-dependent methyltransferase [Ktedonobacter robiniae]